MRHPTKDCGRHKRAGKTAFCCIATRARAIIAARAVPRTWHLYWCQKKIRGARILDGLGAAERPETVRCNLLAPSHRLNLESSRDSRILRCRRVCRLRLRDGR